LKTEATGFPNRRLPEYRFASTSAAAEQNVGSGISGRDLKDRTTPNEIPGRKTAYAR